MSNGTSTLPAAPSFVERAVQQALVEGVADGRPLETFFCEPKIYETARRVIELSGFRLDTLRQRETAQRLTWYALGRYAQERKFI